MSDPLAALLARIPDPTAREVGEILWLLQQGVWLSDSPTPEVLPESRRSPPPSVRNSEHTTFADVALSKDPGPDVNETGDSRAPAAQAQAYPPLPPGFEHPQLIDRALHRLGCRAQVGPRVVDLRASMQRSARLRDQRVPVLARASAPVGHLVIVEDGALSMAPFRRQVRSLVAAARRGDRFARVDAVTVDMSNPERIEAEQPWVRVPVGGPLIVLVIQDGRAPACRGGALRRWLDQLPRHAVVAWLHPWEQRFWTRTPVTTFRVSRPPPQGDGLPLLPLTGAGLEALVPWAQGRGAGALLGVELPREQAHLKPQPTQSLATQIAALFYYRAHPLSQAAVGLAAGVPGGKVDVDLLRMLGSELAQGRITSTHLAEAVTSGFFRRGGEGESTVIEFVSDEAIEQGLRWLPRGDLRRILESLIRYIESGRNRDPALHFSVNLLISLRDCTPPPEDLEFTRGVAGKLRAWVDATGFAVHPKLRALWEPLPGRAQTLNVVQVLSASEISPPRSVDAELLHRDKPLVFIRELRRAHPELDGELLAQALEARASDLAQLGDNTGAVELLSEAVHLRRASRMPDRDLALARSLHELGVHANAIGKLELGESALHEAADLLRRQRTGIHDSRSGAVVEQLVSTLIQLGVVLLARGTLDDALQATHEAANNLRDLIEQDPETFSPVLAGVLSNESVILNALDRPREALEAIREAVELSRARTPRDHEGLARALYHYGLVLGRLGRRSDAAEATGEAVRILDQRVVEDPTLLPQLATTLIGHSGCLRELGRPESARVAAARAVDILRAEAQPGHESVYALATALNNLALVSGAKQACATLSEAIDLLRPLADPGRRQLRTDLAVFLSHLAGSLAQLGRLTEAVQAAREAVEIQHEIVSKSPDTASVERLAGVLTNLALRVADAGGREQAVELSLEAVALFRGLSSDEPSPRLAFALGNLGNQLSVLHDHEGALAAAEEAVEIHRRLAESFQTMESVELAVALVNLGSILTAAGQTDQALSATREALTILRKLQAAEKISNPHAELATTLHNLARLLVFREDWQGMAEAAQEAVALRRSLANTGLAHARRQLAQSLALLAAAQEQLGEPEQAVTLLADALRILPDKAGPDDSIRTALNTALVNCCDNNGLDLPQWLGSEDSLKAIAEDLLNSLAYKLTDEEPISSLIAETNATGYYADEIEVAWIGPLEWEVMQVDFEATIHFIGEQDDERMFYGDTISASVQGVMKFDGEEWAIVDGYDVDAEIRNTGDE